MKNSLLIILALCISALTATAQDAKDTPFAKQAAAKSAVRTETKNVKINCTVQKQTPEDPYVVNINIHVDNITKEPQRGTVSLVVTSPNGTTIKESTFSGEVAPSNTLVHSTPLKFPEHGTYDISYFYEGEDGTFAEGSVKWLTESVNHFYAIGLPHRITVAMPDASGKTIIDASQGSITMWWTYQDLVFLPVDAFREIKADWRIVMRPEIDGKPCTASTWQRSRGYLPVLENRYEDDGISVLLEAVGTETAGLIKVTATNSSTEPHHVRLPWICPGNFKGYNPGWIDEDLPTDHLLAGWNAPADKVLIMGVGADSYPTDVKMTTQMNMDWTIQPGQTATGYLVRPYCKFERDTDSLRNTNWDKEFDAGIAAWDNILSKASKVHIPDHFIEEAFYSGITDVYVMREPAGGGYIVHTPGTNGYRSGPNTGDASVGTRVLLRTGLHDDAREGYRISWEMQEENGDWTDPAGWNHLMWFGTGSKSWMATEYYEHSGDIDFYKQTYPRMLAACRWQKMMRKKTMKLNPDGTKPVTWGLMPKGMGDGGMKNGDSYYGIYFAHNIGAVFADSLCYRAALLIGTEEEIKETKAMYEESHANLIRAMREGCFTDAEGKRYLSAIPGKATPTSSDCGILSAVIYGLMDANDELMVNQLEKNERFISPGGMPMHAGWMADGIQISEAIDTYANVHLLRDEPDAVVSYLYASLNHGTNLLSWCEEQGPYPATTRTSGDMQHLWTPAAVTNIIRNMLITEDRNTLHIGRGISKAWLASGEEIGIDNGSTHFGNVSYRMHYDKKKSRLIGDISLSDRPANYQVIIHAVLPDGMKLTRTSVGKLSKDGKSISITPKAGATIHFEATVR